MAARGLGAVWMTTWRWGSSMAAQTSSVTSLACRAPVGQRLLHCPQLMQITSASGFSMKVEMRVRLPRSMASSTPTSCRSMQVRMQRRQSTHLLMSRTSAVARRVDLVARGLQVAEAVEIDAVFRGQRLQLAVVVAHAGAAVAVVAGQQQIEDVAAGAADLGRVGEHVDRRGDRVTAGGLQGPLPLDLDDADAAHARQAQVLVVAERGDADSQGRGRFQQGGAQRHA